MKNTKINKLLIRMKLKPFSDYLSGYYTMNLKSYESVNKIIKKIIIHCLQNYSQFFRNVFEIYYNDIIIRNKMSI